MKKLIILFAALSLTNAFATKQIPELIEFENKVYQFDPAVLPLESFYTKDKPKPKDVFKDLTTALYRGYVAKWQIVNSKLYLIEIRTQEYVASSKGEIASMKWVEVPASVALGEKFKYPIEAKWFSGRIPTIGILGPGGVEFAGLSPCFHFQDGKLIEITYKSWEKRRSETKSLRL